MAYKPIFLSSNYFLNKLKKNFNVKKAGFSGTLDPFARGTLIVGFGNYTRLFPFINKTPKIYKATLWLGAKSLSLDIENITHINIIKEFDIKKIQDVLKNLIGEIEYVPPKYSAKRFDGKRAYEFARKGQDIELKKIKMNIYNMQLLSYNHPYISFQASVSEGSYIRSIGEMIAKNLGVDGILSSLERIKEGDLEASYTDIKFINPLDVLNYPILKDISTSFRDDLYLGRKISIKNQKSGIYIANFEDFFSIIEVREDKSVKYLLNRMEKC